jgi:formylmethanofuran dehydrogenase subunit B
MAEALRSARYGVILWDAGALPAGRAEAAVANLAGLLLELNRTTRAVGLPLAASHHAVTAAQVCIWQWGVPLRALATVDGPEHDPNAFATSRLLARGGLDALLWISAFERKPPPSTDLPTVALLAPGAAAVEAEVVVDVAIPGVDHAGTAFRMDSVVALPLRQLRASSLPTVAELCDALAARLPARG